MNATQGKVNQFKAWMALASAEMAAWRARGETIEDFHRRHCACDHFHYEFRKQHRLAALLPGRDRQQRTGGSLRGDSA